MRAVGYRLRRVVRASLRQTVALTVVVALVTMVVLALAAGAHRTATAPARFTAANGGTHAALVYQQGGRPRTAEVGRLPGVGAATSVTFLFGGLHRKGSDRSLDGSAFAGTGLFVGTRLVAGRMARASDPHEFVASQTFVDRNHARIGERFVLDTITQKTADEKGFGADADASSTVRLVGIVDGPASLDDPTGAAVFPAKLLAGNRIGVAITIIRAPLGDGVTRADLRRQLDRLPDGRSFFIEAAVPVSPAVATAVDAQSRGLWALTIVGALAAVVVLGQLISRRVRQSGAERAGLAAVGFTSEQVAAEAVGRSAVPIVAGTVVGTFLAPLASGRFPLGFARVIDPSPGVRVDVAVLGLGAVALIVALLVWAGLSLTLTRSGDGTAQPSATVERLAQASPTATAGTGVRLAFTRGASDAGSVRAAIVGLVAIVAALVGTVTFASSLDRLVADKVRWGRTADVVVGANGADDIPAEARRLLATSPAVTGLTYYATGVARVGTTTVRFVGLQRVRGDIGPVVLAGAAPTADDEVAFGRLQAKALGVGVGDRLTLASGSRRATFRVSGIVVVPAIDEVDGIGQSGVLTLEGLRSLAPSTKATSAGVDYRPGPAADALRRQFLPPGQAEEEDPLPSPILNLDRIRAIPYLLAGLLGLLALLTVAHELLLAVQNRRHDVAVLRALGASRRWVSRAVRWQAIALVIVPVVVGPPLGFAVGNVVFGAFADRIGTVDEASLPLLVVGTGGLATLVLAVVVAGLPARLARHVAPAVLLQAE